MCLFVSLFFSICVKLACETAVSPCSSPQGEERFFKRRNVPSGEEQGETAVFAG